MTVTRVCFVALSAVFVAAGCSSDNEPATNTGNVNQGGSNGSGAGAAGGAGGSTGGAGGSVGGAGGSAGSASGSGGSGAESGTGGDAGSGGSAAGSGGAAGTTGGAGGSGGENFSPACDVSTTAAGMAIAKGVACVAADPQLCWKKCGPQSSGWKSETCTGGVYAEADCVFPSSGDYSCFKIPTTQNAACPTDAAMMPQASQTCDVPECNPCNVGGQYKTSSAEVKVGWCICQPANSSGKRTWSCASGTAWPCPLGQGC